MPTKVRFAQLYMSSDLVNMDPKTTISANCLIRATIHFGEIHGNRDHDKARGFREMLNEFRRSVQNKRQQNAHIGRRSYETQCAV